MAEQLILGSFATLQNSSIIATLNANNLLIQNAFLDCLSLTGIAPNQMRSNLDMNSQQIINLSAPATLNSPVRLVDLQAAQTGNPGAIYGLLTGNNIWTGINTFSSGNLILKGSSTGTTALASANSSSTNYTITVPAITDTLATLTASQSLTNKTLLSPTLTGTVTVNALASFNGFIVIKSSVQFTGFYIEQAGGQNVFTMAGTSVTNDNGQIALYNAGVANVAILASGNSYFFGGNVGIGTFTPSVLFEVSGVSQFDGKMTIGAGVLANAASALTITATQPTTPVAGQNAINITITGAGSANQINAAFNLIYASGYTGSSISAALLLTNSNAGTGTTLIPVAGNNGATGNLGIVGNCNATVATGLNIGVEGEARNGSINVGLSGCSQTVKNGATNIGVVGTAINTGTTPVQIGGWFSLNQTSMPIVSSALIADNGSQTNPIFLGQVNGTTSFQIGSTGIVSHSVNTAVGTGSSPLTVLLYSTTANLGIYSGTGNPSFSSVAGSIYIRTDGAAATALYLCTGTTTWVAIT